MAKTRRISRTSRPSRKLRKPRRSRKLKTSKVSRDKIKDPKFASALHKGTKASSSCALCQDKYHYQDYEIFARYLEIVIEGLSQEYVKVPKDMSDMTLGLTMSSGHMRPYYVSDKVFRKVIEEGVRSKKVSLIPIILNLEMKGSSNHANCLVIHKDTKTIELFEPHGHRTSVSTLGGQVGAYVKKMTYLKRYWKERLPEYTVVNVVDAVKKTAFQTDKDPDGHSGFCVTWSLLYTHYRILNPNVPYEVLLVYIDRKITTRLLLRYARKVEETLKST
jgi:hypothetical protein